MSENGQKLMKSNGKAGKSKEILASKSKESKETKYKGIIVKSCEIKV